LHGENAIILLWEKEREETMEKSRFVFLCQEAQAGNDAFVFHPSSGEDGRVLNCTGEHLVVETSEGFHHRWNYHECEKIRRSKEQFPYR
jgi:hypothetical protein